MRIDASGVAAGVYGGSNIGMAHFGKTLRRYREERMWTQTDLAIKSGVSMSLIQKAEAAETREDGISGPKFLKVAAALGKGPEDFGIDADQAPWWINPPRELREQIAIAAAADGVTPEEWTIRRLREQIQLRLKQSGINEPVKLPELPAKKPPRPGDGKQSKAG